MKKTLLVTLDFPPQFGGVANYWANLSQYIPTDDFLVLAPEYNNSLDFDTKQKYLIFRKNLLSRNDWVWPKWLPLLWETFKLVRREKVEKIIVAQILPVGTVALILKKIFKIQYIVSVHGLDIMLGQRNKRKFWLMKKVLQNAEKVLANSNYTKNQVLRLKCNQEQDLEIVYPCPNVCQEADPYVFERTVNTYNLKNKEILLTVGRLIERKGHDKVLESLPEILIEKPDLLYVIIGSGCYSKKLKSLVKNKNLEENVLILEDIHDEELPVFYYLAKVFIMPSRQLKNGDVEGFGIVYLEANSFKKPVIAGRSGGAVEAVEHEINGLLVKPESTKEIANAVIELFNNEEKRQFLGNKGKQRLERKFNWKTQAQKIINLL